MRLRARLEGFRSSLFYVPTLFVLAAIAFAQATIAVDLEIGRRGFDPPALLSATVDSARALLGTVAGATITFAGIAFSVSLLTIQLAANQFSSRVLYTFFRDPFSKRVMGLALGTFTYCLIVLRAVRRPAEDAGEAIVPYVSVFIAVLLGIGAILAIVAFINHSAHSMDTVEVIRRITEETRAQIRALCPNLAGTTHHDPVEGPLPRGAPLVVRSAKDGWVQEIHSEKLLAVAPEGGVVRLDAGAGHFVAEGTPLVTIWPDPGPVAVGAAHKCFHLGRSRTMRQDLGFGFRQLVDIAVRALSPGINDPTTAQEAIEHLGSILRELLMRDLPSRVLSDPENGRRLFRPHDLDHADYVDLAFDQIRRAGTGLLGVATAMLEVMGMLVAECDAANVPERSAPVRRQAALVIAGCEASGALEADLERLRRTAKRYGLENGG